MNFNPGIKPVGHRVLVYPLPVEKKTASGIITETEETSKKAQMGQQDAIVVDLGADCWAEHKQPWASKGEKVLIGRFTGLVRKGDDGQEYRIINDLDVVAVIE